MKKSFATNNLKLTHGALVTDYYICLEKKFINIFKREK